MRQTQIHPAKRFDIQLDNIATDKSISHRCAMFSLLSDKPSRIQNYLLGEDTRNTLKIAQQLGLEVKKIDKNTMEFIPPNQGLPTPVFKEPGDILDCGNAGTAIRLYTGLLSAQKGYFVLTGDKYLKTRPMQRVIKPLKAIGAQIYARACDSLAPITIIGKKLQAFSYQSPIASAQVKSAMILAGLGADGISHFSEPALSRDHTENMLKGMGANIIKSITKSTANTPHSVAITPLSSPLDPIDIVIPSDPSSAFFFALAAAIIPGSKVLLKNVLLNPTRIEAFEILKKMGAKLEYRITDKDYETIGDIIVEQKPLRAITITENIAWLIDELPALAVAMAMATGKSEVRNAQELRVKESDRIHSVIVNLAKMGIVCEEYPDGYAITGGELKNATIESFGDHRIAMSFAIAGLVCGVEIKDSDCIDVSFPNFLDILTSLTKVENERG
ncbi:3-phosphoshikimate 1-carboxyvinyltransferase [Helicobacter sp. 11S02596-1]|uniref:3-phosphoshikimate 1-carboxyvinyltransferase n=1 Tax=Helicobacter sp. 11S02596-1 TaxID=1476194 RepID=UPI000BA7E34E|nr:3-phosphoshikimate 1-carboxyvinyltransferase [Helicobacter sp. 11S02596-1]PAF44461.1 3-phosphoshikimate 1-carboxyvinyltransferase [Helicobacter sp. 11S02596-1]